MHSYCSIIVFNYELIRLIRSCKIILKKIAKTNQTLPMMKNWKTTFFATDFGGVVRYDTIRRANLIRDHDTFDSTGVLTETQQGNDSRWTDKICLMASLARHMLPIRALRDCYSRWKRWRKWQWPACCFFKRVTFHS